MEYTQEDRGKGLNCPRCKFWHTAASCPPENIQSMDKMISELKLIANRLQQKITQLEIENVELKSEVERLAYVNGCVKQEATDLRLEMKEMGEEMTEVEINDVH